jgi:transcriptional regulator with XRE-family HTH domain
MAREISSRDVPVDGLITVDKEERRVMREQREKLGLTQRDLARKLRHRVTAATISNFETGRHPQVQRQLYADIKWALTKQEAPTDGTDGDFQEIVEALVKLDARELGVVRAVVASLKKSH